MHFARMRYLIVATIMGLLGVTAAVSVIRQSLTELRDAHRAWPVTP
jgi:hypothetical protein